MSLRRWNFLRSESRFPDASQCQHEARQLGIAGDRRRVIVVFDGAARSVNGHGSVIRIDQLAENGATSDVLVHFLAEIVQAIRRRAHPDHEVRA